jgi:allantoinase
MKDLVVRSERVVLPEGVRAAAIHIADGRISAVAPYSDMPAGVPRLDFGTQMLLPGLVDTHVHMNDPGRADWEGVEHATRAAAAGGVTTVVDMPLNSIPSTIHIPALEAKRDAVTGRCHVDVGFWGGVVPGNVEHLAPLARAGVLGFKCFLSPSGVDEFEHVSEGDLRLALPELARLRLPLLAHAEWPTALLEPAQDRPRAYGTWLRSRPAEAERFAIELLIALAEAHDAHIHVVHLASGEPLQALSAARARGVEITVETCPHYLTFSAEDIEDGATAFKCAPPIRERAERDRLWQALLDGDIDLIATDHSPAPPSMKSIDEGDFLRAWGGIASLQIGLSAVWTGAFDRGIPIESVAEWMCAAPARLAGLAGRKGTIAAGADADLAAFDPDLPFAVDAATLFHRHPVTPYAGMSLRGKVQTTLLRGAVIVRDGEVVGPASGRIIEAGHHRI